MYVPQNNALVIILHYSKVCACHYSEVSVDRVSVYGGIIQGICIPDVPIYMVSDSGIRV